MPTDPLASFLLQRLSALFPELSNLDRAFSGVLQDDSRRIMPGDLFLALNGTRHRGADFIPQAREKQAALVLLESDQDELYWLDNLPVVSLQQLRARLGQWLAEAHGLHDPALHLIGITGTNGKTSVSHYIARLLEQLQQKAAVIGTVGIGAPDQLQTATHTTPGLLQLHQALADLKQQGFDYQALEVSSHALDQQRTAGVPFDVAVYTNLSRDHLDYHGTMQAYARAKALLFTDYPIRRAVINIDDHYGQTLLQQLEAQQPGRCISVSLSDEQADLYCRSIRANSAGFALQLAGRFGDSDLQLPLLGRFNISNALSAAAVLLALDFAPDAVFRALEQIQPVPGRMQQVAAGGGGPQVVVDYAHTPDALDNALQAVRAHLNGELCCVFGCGGDRDVGKRPLMAEVASRQADRLLLTSDNPRSEDPELILQHVLAGVTTQAVQVEKDRAKAIEQAIAQAGDNDVVLIAGKGHETYQEVAGVRHHFDDVEVALAALERRAAMSGCSNLTEENRSL